jgi:hypothetical protein
MFCHYIKHKYIVKGTKEDLEKGSKRGVEKDYASFVKREGDLSIHFCKVPELEFGD